MQNRLPSSPNSDPSGPSTDWEAIARYLAGESSAEESERIGQWLAEHKADAALLAALDKTLSGLALPEQAGIDVDTALARVVERRDSPTGQPATPVRRSPRELRYTRRTASIWRAGPFPSAAPGVVLGARLVPPRKGGEPPPLGIAGGV